MLAATPSASRSGPLAALISFAASGSTEIWLLKMGGVAQVTVVIADVANPATAVVGLPSLVSALLAVGSRRQGEALPGR